MKKSLLVLFMLVIVSGAYAQKDLMADYNGNFEQGTPALSSVFRDALVDADGYKDVIGDQIITDDPYEGDSAMLTTWVAHYEGLAELVLDTWSTGIPVKGGSSYVFKFAAYKVSGPDAIVHSTLGFFDDGGNVLYEESGNFALGDFYEEFAQNAIVAPEGAATCWLGYRIFAGDGARWPAGEVEVMIDEIQLLETGPSVDIMADYNGNFEQGTPVLSSVFRDALVDADGYKNVIGDQIITDDPYEGDSAMLTTWVAHYEGLAELVLDTWSTGIPVKGGASYVFKFAAYKVSGPYAELRTTVGFFDDGGNVLYEESGSFALGDFYEEFAQAAVVAPEGAVTCWVGFRMYGADGARWPDGEVEAMIDEIKLLETGGGDEPPADDNLFVNGSFEVKDDFAGWRAIEIYFNEGGDVTGVGNFSDEATECSIVYSDNANTGDNAAEILWAASYMTGYEDALFDQQINITSGDTLVFEASAMNVNGPDMILQMRATFFKNDWSNDIDMEDNTWVLEQSATYSTKKIQLVVPEDEDFVLVGFRPRATDGTSFIAEDVTILLDDVKLYLGSIPSTSIRAEFANSEIKVYPNPVLDRLQIESKSELLSVSVCNITGHVVKQQEINRGNTTEVNFEGLPAGIYLVRINSVDGMLTRKVLKN